MKKLSIGIFISLLILSGCSSNKETSEEKEIVVTSFIAYDIASQIVQDKAVVTNIIPWGSEIHDYEPTPKDVTTIQDAGLFIYTSKELDTWVNSLANIEHAIDLSSFVEGEHDHEGEDETHDDHDHASLHYWTDPITYTELITHVSEEIIAYDPGNAESYRANAEAYIQKIQQLDTSFQEELTAFTNPSIVFAGHNAMQAFGDHYGINIHSLSEDYKPNADLTAEQLISLKDSLTSLNQHSLFTEELAEPRAALQVQKELGDSYSVTIKELHGYHNIEEKQAKEGVTYADLLQQNITNILEALRS